jgi:hypothetical protein
MNRSKIRLVPLILLPIACAAAVLGSSTDDVRSGSYARNDLGLITQPAPPALSEDSLYEVPSYPLSATQLAEGPGRAETDIACGSCHTTRYIPMQPPLPAVAWDAEVRKMVKTYGAQISDADARKITQYLQAHYTPETRK